MTLVKKLILNFMHRLIFWMDTYESEANDTTIITYMLID